MAGLRLLQEDVARELEVEAGEIVAISKGLHIYEPTWDLARLLGCH
jgi:thymidylate synthase